MSLCLCVAPVGRKKKISIPQKDLQVLNISSKPEKGKWVLVCLVIGHVHFSRCLLHLHVCGVPKSTGVMRCNPTASWPPPPMPAPRWLKLTPNAPYSQLSYLNNQTLAMPWCLYGHNLSKSTWPWRVLWLYMHTCTYLIHFGIGQFENRPYLRQFSR